MTADELAIGWASVWVSAWALQMSDSAVLVCDIDLVQMCLHSFHNYCDLRLPQHRLAVRRACKETLGTDPCTTKRRGAWFSTRDGSRSLPP